MDIHPIQHERRAAQRFDFQLPVSIRLAGSDREAVGFTQDLSARGAFFYTDCKVPEAAQIELTLVMPSEITLTERMRVRCRGRVVRVVPATSATRTGVAVQVEGYDFLPQAQSAENSSFARISALHQHLLAGD